MQTMLVEQGLQLLVGGLGTVFFFLSILVMLTSAMSSAITNLATSMDPSPDVVDSSKILKEAYVEPRIVRVIQAALHRHFDDN